MGLLWLGLLSSQFSGMGSFGLGPFFLTLCRTLIWLQVVEGLHRRLSDFIHGVVVHRREEAIRVWRNWLREDSLVHPCKWLRPDLVPPAPFCSVILSSLLVVLGFWLIRAGLMRNPEKLGFPTVK